MLLTGSVNDFLAPFKRFCLNNPALGVCVQLYLNATDRDGNRSHGPVIAALQIFLLGHLAGRGGPSTVMKVTGVFDDATRIEVVLLQAYLGMTNQDGFPGPETRQFVKKKCGVDLDALFAAMPPGPGEYAQADGSMLCINCWPAPAA